MGIRATIVLLPALASASTIARAGAPMMGITSMSSRAAYSWDAARGLYMMPQEPGTEPDPRPKDPPKGPRPMAPLPMVGTGDDKVDVISRLLRYRILLLGTQVDDEIANVLVAQLLYLANEDAGADMT